MDNKRVCSETYNLVSFRVAAIRVLNKLVLHAFGFWTAYYVRQFRQRRDRERANYARLHSNSEVVFIEQNRE